MISLIIAVIILISTIKLLRESLNLLLDAVPQSIDLEHIKSIISDTPGVVGLHHLHVRAMSTTENDATMHVILNDVADLEQTKKLLKTALCQQGVQHCTIECETSSEKCNDIGYNI